MVHSVLTLKIIHTMHKNEKPQSQAETRLPEEVEPTSTALCYPESLQKVILSLLLFMSIILIENLSWGLKEPFK